MAAQARLRLHLSKYHIAGNHMSRLNYVMYSMDLSPVFTCITCIAQILSEHSVMGSFRASFLRREKYILGRIGLYFWGFGEKLN